jgi:hypothetical protein
MTYAQHVGFAAQISYGVRVFDLRIGANYNPFSSDYGLYHGPFQLPDYVSDVVNTIKTHLTNNATEFVILLLKFEPWHGLDWSDNFNTKLNNWLGDFLFRRPTHNQLPNPNRWPTVGELRGKVMVMSRFKKPHAHHYDTRAWQGNSGSIALNDVGGGLSMCVQDLYDKPGQVTKENAIKASLTAAKLSGRTQHNKTLLHVNFTSYVVNFAQPRDTGDTLNGWMNNVVGSFLPMTGLICIDAAKSDIVSHIYNQNQSLFM